MASGVGAAAALGAFGTVVAGSATAATLATIATIATVASVAASVLSIGAALTAKKPPGSTVTGSQTSFSANPDDGLPLALGRTGTAGKITFRKGFDSRDAGDNDRQSFISTLSLGPIAAIEGQTVDRSPVSYTSTGAAIGAFAGFMWSMTQLGALPEAQALPFGDGAGTPPVWTAQHKMSGKAAASWTLRFDTAGKVFQAGVPAPMWTVRGVKCYDPTKDSTYPGGSGPHRIADPSDSAAYDAASDTWEWTEDPYLIGLHWAHGFWQRDRSDPNSTYQRVMGIGAPWAMIDVAAFVEGRNVATANGWKCGGVVYSTDGKWDTMKRILQAGMGEPLATGARIGCLVNAPKVSLATIGRDDLRGAVSVSATQPRRNRINTITPRYRLEANNWQTLPGPPITVPEYVALDRGKRSRLIDYHLIQDTDQVATAVRYDIENAREFGPINLPLRLLWMGFKPGDCVTVDLPDEGVGLNGQTILLLNRDINPATGVVTMTARSETSAKHAFALGQTTTPPAAPALAAVPPLPVAAAGDWAVAPVAPSKAVVSPTLVVTGTVRPNVDAVIFEFRVADSGAPWSVAGIDSPTTVRREISGLKADTSYQVAVSYRVNGLVGERRILPAVKTSVDSTLVAVEGKTRVFIQDTAPTADESSANDLWINTADKNKLYARTDGAGALSVGGDVITFGGQRIFFSLWTPHADQRIVDALLAAADAEALAATKSRSFAQELEPDEPNVGDKWYRPSTGIERRWDGTAWQATTDRTALTQHAIPQITDVRVGATYAGAIKSGQLPQSRFVQRLVGNTDVSAQAQIAATATGGVAITVNNAIDSPRRGLITIDPQATLPAECTIRGTSTFDAVSIPFSFKVYRDDDPIPAAGGGAGSGGGASGAASTNSFTAPGTQVAAVEMGRCAAVTTGSAGKVAVSCPLTYYAYDSGEYYGEVPVGSALTARVEYSTNGGTSWTAADAGHTGGGAYQGFESGPRKYDYYEVGYGRGPVDAAASVDASVTITGLGAGASVLIRVTGQWDGFGAGISTVEGTLAAVPS